MSGRIGPVGAYARFVVRRRWLVPVVLAGIIWAAVGLLPGVAGAGGGLSGVLSSSGPAIEAQIASVREFGLPLLTRIAVVQRDPAGLDPETVARSVRHSVEVDRASLRAGGKADGDLLAAFPLVNDPRLVPGAAEYGTTIVTYLFTDPAAGLFVQNGAAYDHAYAGGMDPVADKLVGVAGTIPAQIQQGAVIGEHLPLVETATLAIIALIVGITFRSVVAPLVTVATALSGYLLADRAIGGLSTAIGVAAPAELEPVIVALILGITTDYSIFFLSGLQRRLQDGRRNPGATRAAVREYLPIVLTAGVTVACAG